MSKPKIVMGFIYDEERGYLTLEEYSKQIRKETIAEISREIRLLYGNEYEKQIRAELIEELRNRHLDDNSWCEYTVDVIADELEDIAEQLKEQKGE